LSDSRKTEKTGRKQEIESVIQRCGGYSKTTIGVPKATTLKYCFPQENNTLDMSISGMEIVVLL
jgi:hypothetical protein